MEELYVDSEEKLSDLCRRIESSDVIAIDTEFLREKTYYAQVCLIQIATDEVIACVDPLAISNLDPFLDLLYQPDKLKIMHSARQDLEIFFDLRGAIPQPVYDTQIAATLLGHGDQLGYAKLVKVMMSINVDKEHARTDWSQRPLDEAQIHYAMNDVRYLIPMYRQQMQRLREKGRDEWLQADFESLADINIYAPAPDQVWKRVKGSKLLKRGQLVVLQQLASWREQYAKQSNRPRKWIIPDDVLIDIARRCPTSVEAMEKIRGWNSYTKKFANDILQQIQHAKSIPEDRWPSLEHAAVLTVEQDAMVDFLMGIVRMSALKNDVTPALLATRKDLEHLVLGRKDINVLSGWRYELAGKELLEFLNGKKAIVVEENHIVVIDDET